MNNKRRLCKWFFSVHRFKNEYKVWRDAVNKSIRHDGVHMLDPHSGTIHTYCIQLIHLMRGDIKTERLENIQLSRAEIIECANTMINSFKVSK